MIVTPNHVYLDQLRPHYAAVKKPKIFGQLVCPSQPEARQLILQNFERWFGDLADAGLRFSAFTAFAYDYGGCGCDKCQPWILTFATLMKEIHAVAQRRHPDLEPWFCSWWWTPEEHTQLNDWAAREAPGWLKAVTLHIEYGQTRPQDVLLPAGCRKLAFVHMESLDRAIGRPAESEWTPERLALADQYFAARERLYREVYRLGPVRHVLNPRFMPPDWEASWRKTTGDGAHVSKLLPQQ